MEDSAVGVDATDAVRVRLVHTMQAMRLLADVDLIIRTLHEPPSADGAANVGDGAPCAC